MLKSLSCLLVVGWSAFGFSAERPAYFISIDGLQPSLLQTMKNEGQLVAPRGFAWLLDHSLVVDRAMPVQTSITAPSHVSTITCSPPSRHGIIANEFMQDGKTVDGFATSFPSEPLWKAAMRQGLKVLALAYVASDGRNPDRSASFGLAYPDPKRLGPAQMVPLKGSDIMELTLVLNPETQEKRSIFVQSMNGSARVSKSRDMDKDSLGLLKSDGSVLDVFSEESGGMKRRSILRLLPGKNQGEWMLAVSRSSYNNAYPASFRDQLDALNLVWPDYGSHGMDLPMVQAIEAESMIDRFLTDVAVQMVPALKVDVVLFYQPLLDTIAHKLQSRLPLPFHGDAKDEVSQAFAAGFRQIDQNLSRLLANADEQTPIALMGDHGMNAVKRMVNVGAFMRPSALSKVRWVRSGELLLLYPAEGEPAAKVDAIGLELKTVLETLKDPEGAGVLARASRRRDFPARDADYRKEWQFGDAIWAFQGHSGDWLTFDGKARELFQKPRAGGMHGTAITEASMATTLLIHGPRVKPQHVGEGSLIQAVPTFVQMLGIKPPAQCLGTSLLPE